MMIDLEYAKDPVMQATGIELVCKFTHLDVEVPFFAMADDPEQYGRDIFNRAMVGEFGEVVPFIPPTPDDIAARDNPRTRSRQMKLATEKALHGLMMGDVTQTTAWRSYYRTLYALEHTPGWPMVEQWPTPPDGLG